MEMTSENRVSNNGNGSLKEDFKIRLASPMLYDRLHTLSAEYSMPVELLVSVAVKRLLDDVDFVRKLRAGKIESE